MRYWKGKSCIIDLDEVCAISVNGFTPDHRCYTVTFKNGTNSTFYGNDLITQFEQYVMKDL